MLKPDAFVDGKKEKVIQELEKYGLHVESSCLLEVDMEVMKILLDHYQQVIDEKGVVVKLGDNDITCTIEGPAHLLGLEGSDNSDMSDYTDNHHRAFHGRLLTYLQTVGEKGQIRVKFTSPLLQGTEIVLNAK